MGKKTKLDWDFAEDESVWQQETAVDGGSAASAKAAGGKLRWTSKKLFILLIACVMPMAIATFVAYGLHQRSEEKIAVIQGQLHDELQQVVDAESAVWQHGDQEVAATFLDRNVPGDWLASMLVQQEWLRYEAGAQAQKPEVHVEAVELQGDLALVTTVVEKSGLSWLPQPFRESRFYRDSYRQWVRTKPGPEFWGASEQLAMGSFRFIFNRRDGDAVKRFAGQVESIYRKMRQEAGLPEPIRADAVVVEVTLQPDRDYQMLYRTVSGEVARALPISVEKVRLSDVQWACSWQPPQNYGEAQSSICPEKLEIHFTGEVLQAPSPLMLPLPLEMSESEALSQTLVHALAGRVLDEALQGQKVKVNWLQLIQGIRLWLGCHSASQPLTWLYLMDEVVHDLAAHDRSQAMMHGAGVMTYHADMRIATAATLVDYAVGHYGSQSLPALIAALSHYDSWQTLIPAVYGVSAEQFEQGWRDSLKRRAYALVSIP